MEMCMDNWQHCKLPIIVILYMCVLYSVTANSDQMNGRSMREMKYNEESLQHLYPEKYFNSEEYQVHKNSDRLGKVAIAKPSAVDHEGMMRDDEKKLDSQVLQFHDIHHNSFLHINPNNNHRHHQTHFKRIQNRYGLSKKAVRQRTLIGSFRDKLRKNTHSDNSKRKTTNSDHFVSHFNKGLPSLTYSGIEKRHDLSVNGSRVKLDQNKNESISSQTKTVPLSQTIQGMTVESDESKEVDFVQRQSRFKQGFKIHLWKSKQLVNEAVTENTEVGKKDHNLAGQPGQGYYIEVSIGSPPQKLNVLVDTGSSNFAVAAAPHPDINKYFKKLNSTTYQENGTEVFVPYTQGHWRGPLGNDIVTFPSMPAISARANIALITNSNRFFINESNWQGILGLAYADIARPDASVQPFFDSLTQQNRGSIQNFFSLQLCSTVETPKTEEKGMGGALVIGGVDNSLGSGPFYWSLMHREWYYEVVITDVMVSNTSLGMPCVEYNTDKSIVDSGTTNLRLPTKVYHQLVKAISKELKPIDPFPPPDFWTGEKMLCWEDDQVPWTAFPEISLYLASTADSSIVLRISPQMYLRAGDGCYKFSVDPSNTGSVLGAVVLEGYYIVFDRENKTVGFAETACNPRTTEIPPSKVYGTIATANTPQCQYVKPEPGTPPMVIVAYVLAGVSGVCILPLLVLIIQWKIQQCRKQKQTVTDIQGLMTSED